MTIKIYHRYRGQGLKYCGAISALTPLQAIACAKALFSKPIIRLINHD